MITYSDFSSLAGYLDEVFNETAGNAIAESIGMTKVFQTIVNPLATYQYLAVHGLGGASKVADGEELPAITSDQGNTATWSQDYYGVIIPITKKLRTFSDARHPGAITAIVKSTIETVFNQIDQSLSDCLLYGWSSSYQNIWSETETSTAVDSNVLFYTAHTYGVATSSRTFRNQIRLIDSAQENPDLSRQAIVDAVIDGRNYKDVQGVNRPVHLDTLLVAPKMYDDALRHVQSTGVSGTPNVDINPLKGWIKEVVCWDRLSTDCNSNDKSSYWFLYDSKKVGDSLKAIFAEKPSLDAPEIVYKTKNWEWSIDFFYVIARAFPAYVWGSNATNA